MNTHTEKTQGNKSQSLSNENSQMESIRESAFQFIDNRPEAISQRKLQETANNSPRVKQLKAIQEMAINSPQLKKSAQLQAVADKYSAQTIQKQGLERKETLQGKFNPIQKKENNTVLPDNLKSGMEKETDMTGKRALDSPSAKLVLMARNYNNDGVTQRAVNPEEEEKINETLSNPREKHLLGDTGKLRDADDDDITTHLKKARDKDVALRLTSFGEPFSTLIQDGGLWHGEGVTWDFKHWLADGEMPPDFGYGFSIREYFKGLSSNHQKEFTEKCKGMRSATNITRIIGQYPLTQETVDGFKPERKKDYLHTRGILDETKSSDSVIGNAKLLELMGDPMKNLKSLAEEVIKSAKGGKDAFRELELSLASMGDEIWKEIAKVAPKKGFGQQKEFPKKHQEFGSALMKIGKFVDEQLNETENTDIKSDVKRVFGKVIRSWGDATASIGYDPYGKMITDAQSSTTDDYSRNKDAGMVGGDGEKAMAGHKEHLEQEEGKNAWCDMFASGSMWNLAANYDRYRDTIVTLYVQEDHGAQLGRGNEQDPFKMRVTAAELQLGVLNAYFTKFEGTKGIDERGPLDARNMRSDVIGGTKGLPDKSLDLNRKGASDEVARDLGWMRVMGDGSMQYLVKAEGDSRWYTATPDGDALKVDFS